MIDSIYRITCSLCLFIFQDKKSNRVFHFWLIDVLYLMTNVLMTSNIWGFGKNRTSNFIKARYSHLLTFLNTLFWNEIVYGKRKLRHQSFNKARFIHSRAFFGQQIMGIYVHYGLQRQYWIISLISPEHTIITPPPPTSPPKNSPFSNRLQVPAAKQGTVSSTPTPITYGGL